MSTGWKRLFIAINILVSVPITVMTAFNCFSYHPNTMSILSGIAVGIGVTLAVSLIYWGLILLAAWVIRGFREKPGGPMPG